MMKVISNEEIAVFCTELSLLLHAGMGAGDALCLLASEGEQSHLVSAIAEKVDEGMPISDALKESQAFPAYVCGLVATGERTGRLEEALKALAGYYETRVRMVRRIRSAILYPALMMGLMLIVIGVLLIKVLPVFDEVYASLGGNLTGVAARLLDFGQWLERGMPVLWGILAFLTLFAAAGTVSASFRAGIIAAWQKQWGDKGISRKMNNAKLAQALSMGMASGLPLEESLDLAAGLLSHKAKARCMACLACLDEGKDLHEALRASELLPASQCRLLELGQRSGAGDGAMAKIADDLTEASENALEDSVSRVEPALVLICSLLVGLILLSVMLPLMNIMAAIG